MEATESPFMAMFGNFREELDEHHDRRERVIKVSRDITALSKKMSSFLPPHSCKPLTDCCIGSLPFKGEESLDITPYTSQLTNQSLPRVRQLHQPLPKNIAAENVERLKTIDSLFQSISKDLQGINHWRYQRQISAGIQEFMEAIAFDFYLRNQTLVSCQEGAAYLEKSVQLTEDDYLLGIFDLVGELMRFAITSMATLGTVPGSSLSASNAGQETSKSNHRRARSMLEDLRSLRAFLESLDTNGSHSLNKEMEKKLDVMKACVEKVELAAYGMIIRGCERPPG
ncbi:MAG: hypothetical protein M1829_001235 [Trizodia sp. TS-e1964]|nr:MAG: hypothetical protein M1829_001235 [Trizodia sp. TS-e1964]